MTPSGSKASTETADNKALDGSEEVEYGLGTYNEVERRRQRGTVIEVTHPELGPRELPLAVSVILAQTEIHEMEK